MLDLVHSLLGNGNLTPGSLLRLLDETVEHHDSLADQGAKEDTSNAFWAFQPKLKKTIAKSLRVRITKIWAERDHSPSQDHLPRSQTVGQIKDLCLNLRAVVANAEVHC